jgi:hypothetical protein
MNCAGSNNLLDELPPGVGEGTSPHAAEGTAAHALAEACLTKHVSPSAYHGFTFDGFEVDEEMIEAVSLYVNYCVGLQETCELTASERRFSLDSLSPPRAMFGTADFVGYETATDTLHVVDLKYGRGVVVEVKGNPQVRYYALGALLAIEKEFGVTPSRIAVTVIQPRVNHPDGRIRTEVLEYDDLMEFALILLERAHATLAPDAPRTPGPWCRWCQAAAVCPEKAQESLQVAQQEFGVAVTPPDPQSLTAEELQWIMERLPALEEWTRQVRQHATEVLESGGHIPGFKLVQKRAYRKWTHASAVEQWAEDNHVPDDDLYEMKVRSPAQLEKRLGKGNVPEELIVKESSGVTLVEESDARPAVVIGAEFDLLPNPEVNKEKSK